MKLWTTLVTTLLALSLWAGSNQPAASNKGRDSKANSQHHDAKPKEKPGQDRDRDSHHDRDHGKGNNRDDHHDPRDCNDDRHDHGHGKPKPPKPPKPPKDPAGIPTVPTRLTAEAVSLFQVNLTWTDNSTNELGFKIERSLDGKHFTQIAQVLPNTTVYRDLNRFPGTRYVYRARAFNVKGNSAHTAIARVQTPAPDCRLSLVAASGGFGSGLPSLNEQEIVAIAAGSYFGLLLKSDGTVMEDANFDIATVTNLDNVIAIAAGGTHRLALKRDGTVSGWADDNYYGQASPPSGLSNVTAIAAGGFHSLALKNDGCVVAWGNDDWWQTRVPTNLTGVVAIAAGLYHSLALRSDGTVVGWGYNDENAAQPPAGLRDVIAVSAGSSHSLALKSDGTVVGWGTSPAANIPTNLTDVIAIAAGQNYSAALKSNEKVISWFGPNSPSPWPIFPGVPELESVAAIGLHGQNYRMLAKLPSSPSALGIKLHANHQVQLNWVDSSVSETGYLVERDLIEEDNSYVENWERLATLAADSTNFVDASAIAGKMYSYVVRPQNACGTSGFWTAQFVIISPPTSAPIFTSITPQGDNVVLSWDAANLASFGIVEYRLERAADVGGQPGEWREIAVVGPNPVAYYSQEIRYTDPDLPLNSTNWYRVLAVNGLGISPYSQARSVGIVQPATPQLSYTINDADHVRLSWSGFGWSDLVGFSIERTTNILNSVEPWEEIAVIPPANPPQWEFADTTALPGLVYWYRIRAFNDAGTSGYSKPTWVNLLLPPPLSMYAFSISNAAVLTTWASFAPEVPGLPNINFDYTGEQQLQFERAVDASGVPGRWLPISPQLQLHNYVFADYGLAANQTYWYRAKLSTWLGDSPFSTPVSVTIVQPQPPQEVRAHIGSTNHITLRWRPAYRYDIWPMNLQEQFGYKIERAIETSAGTSAWTEIGTVGLTNSRYYNFEDTVSGIGQTYRYRVRSFNSAGQSTYAESFPIALLPPPKPWLGASVYINQVRVNFGVPVVGVTGFRLQRAPDVGGTPGDWSNVALFPPQESAGNNYTDVAPAIESGYWYRVQAYNWLGDSEFCAPVAALIQPPQAPALLRAKIGSTNQIALVWTHNGSDATAFQIERAQTLNGGLGTWEEISHRTASEAWVPDAFVGVDSNAQAHANYVYRIRATNIVGSSPYSELLAFRVVPPPPLTAIELSARGGRVHLSWNSFHSFHDYGEINGFEIERALDDAGTPQAWTPIAHVYDYSFVDNNPPPDSTCRYRVRVVNWVGGSDYLESASVTIVPPEPPRQLAARVGGTNQVELSWLASAANDQDGFLLELADDVAGPPAAWQPLATIGTTNLWGANFTQTNAVAFATNWYRVRAFNPAGVSAATEPLQFIVSPPPAPVLATPSQFADRVKLAWNAYTAGEVGGFKVERAVDLGGNPGTWTEIARVSATNSYSGWWYGAFADAGRTVDTTYWYRVRSFNWVGDGDPSAALTHTVKGPPSPYILNARIGTTNEVLVSWFPGHDDVEGYQLERAFDAGGSPGDWRLLATVPNSGLSLRFTDTNLTSYATNWYRVRAFNVLGFSVYTAALAVGVVPPPSPVVYEANVFANQVRLKWYLPGANYGEVSGGKLERAIDESGVPGIWSEVLNLPKDQPWADYQEFVDADLSPDTTYWYRLRSYNWLGNGPYSPATNLTIIPPRSPLNLVATIHGTDFVELFWNAAAPQDQDGFKLERNSDAQNTWTELVVIPATNYYFASYADTNFVPNVPNYYRVRAFNIVGDSDYSPTVSSFISRPVAEPTSTTIPIRIESLVATNKDVFIVWTGWAGTTNVVEAAPRPTEAFTPISANLRLEGDGNVTTNFLDVGALTNSAARFYRIREVR